MFNLDREPDDLSNREKLQGPKKRDCHRAKLGPRPKKDPLAPMPCDVQPRTAAGRQPQARASHVTNPALLSPCRGQNRTTGGKHWLGLGRAWGGGGGGGGEAPDLHRPGSSSSSGSGNVKREGGQNRTGPTLEGSKDTLFHWRISHQRGLLVLTAGPTDIKGLEHLRSQSLVCLNPVRRD